MTNVQLQLKNRSLTRKARNREWEEMVIAPYLIRNIGLIFQKNATLWPNYWSVSLEEMYTYRHNDNEMWSDNTAVRERAQCIECLVEKPEKMCCKLQSTLQVRRGFLCLQQSAELKLDHLFFPNWTVSLKMTTETLDSLLLYFSPMLSQEMVHYKHKEGLPPLLPQEKTANFTSSRPL